MEKFIYLKSFTIDEKGDLKEGKDIKTPLVLIENIPNFKQNSFWINIKNLWVLVGKIPPLNLEKDDLVLLKENNKRWGMFIFLDEIDDYIILQDGKRNRKTKVSKDVLKKLKLFGKVLKVQTKV